MNRTATSNGTGSVDLAVVTFGGSAKILRRFNSLDPIKETRDKMRTIISEADKYGGTPTFDAMNKTWKLFNETGRNDSFKAMFVVSDGLPYSPKNVKDIKPKLEADNITIYGLYLGDRKAGKDFMMNEMVSNATTNESFFFHVEDMKDDAIMAQKLDLVVTGICDKAAKQQGTVYIINGEGSDKKEKEKTTIANTATTGPQDVPTTTGPEIQPKSTGFPTWAIAAIAVGSGLLIVAVATSSVVLYKRSGKGFSARGAVKDAGFGVDIASARSVKEPVSKSKTVKQRASRSSAKTLLTKAIREK